MRTRMNLRRQPASTRASKTRPLRLITALSFKLWQVRDADSHLGEDTNKIHRRASPENLQNIITASMRWFSGNRATGSWAIRTHRINSILHKIHRASFLESLEQKTTNSFRREGLTYRKINVGVATTTSKAYWALVGLLQRKFSMFARMMKRCTTRTSSSSWWNKHNINRHSRRFRSLMHLLARGTSTLIWMQAVRRPLVQLEQTTWLASKASLVLQTRRSAEGSNKWSRQAYHLRIIVLPRLCSSSQGWVIRGRRESWRLEFLRSLLLDLAWICKG